ncbi:DUF1659 domain-containing protein [Alkalihalobacillus pseudalcaliphilus]|uniref:DUF1659 domain-containing protein n=1 Tax=Alkalihalobacillus pseudalcaliphilus TaxID=79884 RepID=UPI00064E0640|nr:DUF1659 domain-containing protein [Alkalihalobacillus pseudalcaliphilus]KMK76028.1 hypothetical protein AB990_12400 [Alkalihalobacillus pseudalcaliphilus]
MEAQNSRLALRFIVGTDEFGEISYLSKSFQLVKGSANDEELVQFAQAYVSLQQYQLEVANRINQYGII